MDEGLAAWVHNCCIALITQVTVTTVRRRNNKCVFYLHLLCGVGTSAGHSSDLNLQKAREASRAACFRSSDTDRAEAEQKAVLGPAAFVLKEEWKVQTL